MKKSLGNFAVDRSALRSLSNGEIAKVIGGVAPEAPIDAAQLSKLPGRWKVPDPT
jgi:hypothetical protein